MNLLEYEAKDILKKFAIPVPKGQIITLDSKIVSPVILKSQVHTGGRGKLGGVKLVKDSKNIIYEINHLLNLEIKCEKPSKILAEEVLDIDREFYLSILINRDKSSIELLANKSGGIEVETLARDSFWTAEIDGLNNETLGESLAEYLDLPGQTFAIQELLAKLLKCLKVADAMMIEINPLVLTKSDELIAADCKMILDNDAGFRHSEWSNFSEAIVSSNYVILDKKGTVATVANGAGLAMATVDAVHSYGLTPANFLDIGGSATVESITSSFEEILKLKSVKHIIINIFAGIVRADDVAEAIIIAKERFKNLPNLYIRLSGNRSDEARALLEKSGLSHYSSLTDCLKAIKS